MLLALVLCGNIDIPVGCFEASFPQEKHLVWKGTAPLGNVCKSSSKWKSQPSSGSQFPYKEEKGSVLELGPFFLLSRVRQKSLSLFPGFILQHRAPCELVPQKEEEWGPLEPLNSPSVNKTAFPQTKRNLFGKNLNIKCSCWKCLYFVP